MALRSIEWPGGAQIAVTLTVALELWEGSFVETGYHDGPPVSVPQELLDAGYVDRATLSWQDYGPKRGMWRLLEILDRYPEVHVTAPISGIAIEQYPDLIRAWHERGHEICSHSWAQDVRTWKLSTDEEEANISRCSEVTRKVTGEAPTGWISPSAQQGDETLRLLHNAGYLWHGDCSDDDVPYLVDVPGGGSMVAIPYQYDLNDLKIYIKGMNHAGVYVTWFQQKFDTLYAEGVASPKMINATVHAALYGRPYGSWAFEECIKYARQHSNVWFATRAEIADWVRKRAKTQSDS